MSQQILTVLPKISSYRYQESDRQFYVKSLVYSFLDWCKGRDLQPLFFKEDMLAVELLHQHDVSWESVLSPVDEEFLINFVEDYPEAYKTLSTVRCNERYYTEAREKYLVKTLLSFRGDKRAYLEAKLNVLQMRIKYTAERRLSLSKCVAQFINNNNFTKEIKPYIGDGKLLVTVDFNMAIYRYTYGGIPCEPEMVDRIIENM